LVQRIVQKRSKGLLTSLKQSGHSFAFAIGHAVESRVLGIQIPWGFSQRAIMHFILLKAHPEPRYLESMHYRYRFAKLGFPMHACSYRVLQIYRVTLDVYPWISYARERLTWGIKRQVILLQLAIFCKPCVQSVCHQELEIRAGLGFAAHLFSREILLLARDPLSRVHRRTKLGKNWKTFFFCSRGDRFRNLDCCMNKSIPHGRARRKAYRG